MYKNEVLAIFQQEKNTQRFNNSSNNSRIYGRDECNIIAQVINYCFDTGQVATFKDLDQIVKLVKSNLNGGVISTFKNVVVYHSIDDIVVQCSRNDKDDMTKINTTLITLGSRGVQGESKTYVMEKANYTGTNIDESFAERELSRCRIEDVNSVSVSRLSKEERDLYQKMRICSSLLKPVLKRLESEKPVITEQQELNSMFDDNLDNELKSDKKASL